MTPSLANPGLDRLQRVSLIVGVVALACCIAGAISSPGQFFRSYLVAYLLWSGVAFGSLGVVMLHHLVGGGWGYLLRRPLEAALATWPLFALLFVPLLFGLHSLYLWAQPEQVKANELLQHKEVYLNVDAFIVRAIIYFAIWAVLARFLNKWSLEQDSTDSRSLLQRLQNLSGPGLILYWLIVTYASVDWVMSLEPEWFSTIFSAIFVIGQCLSAAAFVAALLWLLLRSEPLSALAVPKYLNDVGNLLLMFVMLWAYMQFGQILIIWSGNLTDEIPWYVHRVAGSWEVVCFLLALFHFAVPFVLLLQRTVKRKIQRLAWLAIFILVFRWIDMIWLVEPAFDRSGMVFHWMDWAAPLGIGGIWIAAYVRELKRRRLLPEKDPRLPLVFERIEHARVGDV